MKFRCERDVLDRAFSIARRAVSGRGGSLPVLSGLHLHVWVAVPLGLAIISVAAVLWITAILLARKILAVDI